MQRKYGIDFSVYLMPFWSLAAMRVFFISMAIVMGPTPPGTGVIAEHFGSTEAKSTSPQSLPFSSRFMPTSMTTAPSEFRLSDRGYQNVSPAGDFGEVLGTAVADRDGAVLVEQQHCHRLSDDIASADHHTLLTGYLDAAFLDKLHDAGGSAGKKVVFADHDLADVFLAESVHIFFGSDRFCCMRTDVLSAALPFFK